MIGDTLIIGKGGWAPRHVVVIPPKSTVQKIADRAEKNLAKKGIDVVKNSVQYRNEYQRVFMKLYRVECTKLSEALA